MYYWKYVDQNLYCIQEVHDEVYNFQYYFYSEELDEF